MIDEFIEQRGGITDNTDILWNELDLGGLLSGKVGSVVKQAVEENMSKEKREAAKKFEKKCKKANYNVVINRYEAQPHKPAVMTRQSLERLADPIRIRARADGEGSDRDHSGSPSKGSGSGQKAAQFTSPLARHQAQHHGGGARGDDSDGDADGGGGFFLTGTDLEEQPRGKQNARLSHNLLDILQENRSPSNVQLSGGKRKQGGGAAKFAGDPSKLDALAVVMEEEARLLRQAAAASRTTADGTSPNRPSPHHSHLDRNISNTTENIERLNRMKHAIAAELGAEEEALPARQHQVRVQPAAKSNPKRQLFGRDGVVGKHVAQNPTAVREKATAAMRTANRQGRSRNLGSLVDRQKKKQAGGSSLGFNKVKGSGYGNNKPRERSTSRTRSGSTGRGRSGGSKPFGGSGGGTFLTGGAESSEDEGSRRGRARGRERSTERTNTNARNARNNSNINSNRGGARGRSQSNEPDRDRGRSRSRSTSVDRAGPGAGNGARSNSMNRQKSQAKLPVIQEKPQQQRQNYLQDKRRYVMEKAAGATGGRLVPGNGNGSDSEGGGQRLPAVGMQRGGAGAGGGNPTSSRSRANVPSLQRESKSTPGLLPGMVRGGGRGGGASASSLGVVSEEAAGGAGDVSDSSRGRSSSRATKAKSAGYMAPGGAGAGRGSTFGNAGGNVRSNSNQRGAKGGSKFNGTDDSTGSGSGNGRAGRSGGKPPINPLRYDAMAAKKQELIAFLAAGGAGAPPDAGEPMGKDKGPQKLAAIAAPSGKSIEEVNYSLEQALERSLALAGNAPAAVPVDAMTRNKLAVSAASKKLAPVGAGGGGGKEEREPADDGAMAALLASHAKRISEKLQQVNMHTSEYSKLKGPPTFTNAVPPPQTRVAAPSGNGNSNDGSASASGSPTKKSPSKSPRPDPSAASVEVSSRPGSGKTTIKTSPILSPARAKTKAADAETQALPPAAAAAVHEDGPDDRLTAHVGDEGIDCPEDAEKSFFTAMISRNLSASISNSSHAVSASAAASASAASAGVLPKPQSPRSSSARKKTPSSGSRSGLRSSSGAGGGGGAPLNLDDVLDSIDVDAELDAFVKEQQAKMFGRSVSKAPRSPSKGINNDSYNGTPSRTSSAAGNTYRQSATPLLDGGDDGGSVDDLMALHQSFEDA